MASHSNNKAPSLQDPAPSSGALATIKASLEAESDVGEVTTSLKTIEYAFSGDGHKAQYPSRYRSSSCSSNADDHLDLEAISDTLPSEASPANLGGDFGRPMEMILLSHTANTAANVSDELQSEHTRNLSTTSSNSPWGADSPWGTYRIPEEFDEQGRMTQWTTAILHRVQPYVEESRQGQQGGSGILDTDDPTHFYLMMPLGSLDTAPEVPAEIEEQRRMYSEAVRLERHGDDDHTGLTDIESSDDSSIDDSSSNEDDTDFAQENDLNTSNSETAIVPTGPTYGGLWNNPGTRDVRESRYFPELDWSQIPQICTDDTGSVFSWTSDECDPGDAEAQAHKFPRKSEDKCNMEVKDMQAPIVPTIFKNECDTEVEDMQAHNVRNRIFVATTGGGTVRIDLPRVIVISYPGKPTTELPFSITNLSKTCWDIIKDHGIAGVRVVNADKSTDNKPIPWTIARQFRSGLWFDTKTSSSPAFDSIWIQTNATLAMKEEFPFIEYYLDIQAVCDRSLDALAPEQVSFFYYSLNDLSAHYLLNKPLAPPNGTLEEQMADGIMISVDESNLTVPQFIKRLYIDSKLQQKQLDALRTVLGPNIRITPSRTAIIEDPAAMVDDWPVEERVLVPRDFDHDNIFDLQQFNWVGNVGLPCSRVREERDSMYVEYRNTNNKITHMDPMLTEAYNLANFVPKAMYTKYKASTPHKQLRNLMACKSYNAVVYASDRGADCSKVFHYHPFHDMRECIIDLSKTSNETAYAEPVRISTVALSTGDYYRGICMVGGFDGEYALRNMLHDAEDRSVVVGHATRASYGIINHIDIDYYAHGNEYRAVMACNDNKIRILDVETNTFFSDPGSNTNTAAPAARSGELSGHLYPWPVNCTAMCPDGKLRVVVGDTTDVVVVNAESGISERILKGHDDYGFACAWSPDGCYIATANQDRLVKIWDTRTWRVVTEFAAQVAGYRSMRWSPVGGGSKCLLLAEPADRVCVVNATTYETMQTHEFYGEIVGMDFQADGTGFWVANGDEKFGGMMEYERRGYGQTYGFGFLQKKAIEAAGGVYREQGPNEWVWERERGDDPRVVDPTRTGASGNWALNGL